VPLALICRTGCHGLSNYRPSTLHARNHRMNLRYAVTWRLVWILLDSLLLCPLGEVVWSPPLISMASNPIYIDGQTHISWIWNEDYWAMPYLWRWFTHNYTHRRWQAEGAEADVFIPLTSTLSQHYSLACSCSSQLPASPDVWSSPQKAASERIGETDCAIIADGQIIDNSPQESRSSYAGGGIEIVRTILRHQKMLCAIYLRSLLARGRGFRKWRHRTFVIMVLLYWRKSRKESTSAPDHLCGPCCE